MSRPNESSLPLRPKTQQPIVPLNMQASLEDESQQPPPRRPTLAGRRATPPPSPPRSYSTPALDLDQDSFEESDSFGVARSEPVVGPALRDSLPESEEESSRLTFGPILSLPSAPGSHPPPDEEPRPEGEEYELRDHDENQVPVTEGPTVTSSHDDGDDDRPTPWLDDVPDISSPTPVETTQKRQSPSWVSHASQPSSAPQVESEELEEHAASLDFSDLRDSQPLDDDSVPTPTDSEPAPDAEAVPKVAAVLPTSISDPLSTSPFRPLTDHVPPTLSVDPIATRIMDSPSRIGSRISPSKPKGAFSKPTPIKSPFKSPFIRTRSREQYQQHHESSDDFTSGMVDRPPPQAFLKTMFAKDKKVQESSCLEYSEESDPSPASPSTNSRAALPLEATFVDDSPPAAYTPQRPQQPLEATYIDNPLPVASSPQRGPNFEATLIDIPQPLASTPPRPTTPTRLSPSRLQPFASTPQISSPPPDGGDTQVDDDLPPLFADYNTPPHRRRFGDLLPTSCRQSETTDLLDSSQRSVGVVTYDGDDYESFVATQVMKDQPCGSPGRSSLLFSSPSPRAKPEMSPPHPVPRNTPRATSTMPKATTIPEGRRLQRRAQTSISDGKSLELRLPPRQLSPAYESTFINPPEGALSEGQHSSLEPIKSNEGVGTEEPAIRGNGDVEMAPVDEVPEETELDGARGEAKLVKTDDVMAPATPQADIHEVSGHSLVRTSPVRPSPKKYGRKYKNRSRTAIRAPDSDGDDEGASDDSGSTVDDPEDHTYLDAPQPESHEFHSFNLLSIPPSVPTPPKITAEVKRHARPARASSSTAAAAPRVGPSTTRGIRGKRKALSPSPSLSGPSSGSAPEDEEDFTYRPANICKGKGKARVSTPKPGPLPTPGVSRGARPTKKIKTTTTHSTRSTSSRAASVAAPAILQPNRDSPITVLAFWAKTGQYHVGTISARNKAGFKVKFVGGGTATTTLEKMRVLELKPGEPVRNGSNNAEDLMVTAAFDGTGDVVEVLDDNSEPRSVSLANLVVLATTIEKRFKKRFVDPALPDARFPPPVAVPAASNSAVRPAVAVRAAPGGDNKPFNNQVFLISRGEARVSTDRLKKKITQNGGHVEDDWQALFEIRDDGYEITTLRVPFVIQIGSGAVMSPKHMAALAAGIPILAPRYIEDAIKHGDADWRSYLVPAGESKYLYPGDVKNLFVSQLVDPQWGSAVWIAKTAHALRRPLAGQTVLFIEPQRAADKHGLRVLVPFCLVALGAAVDRADAIPDDLAEYDLVLVEDRDKGVTITREQRATGKLVNVPWLKNCLPLGKALPAQLVSTAE